MTTTCIYRVWIFSQAFISKLCYEWQHVGTGPTTKSRPIKTFIPRSGLEIQGDPSLHMGSQQAIEAAALAHDGDKSTAEAAEVSLHCTARFSSLIILYGNIHCTKCYPFPLVLLSRCFVYEQGLIIQFRSEVTST